MIHCYTAKDAEEASLLVLDLHANGIEAKTTGNLGAVAFGELPADVLRVKIFVPDAQVEAAGELIRAFFARSTKGGVAQGEPWSCPSCGEENEPTFEVCWSCQAVAPGA